MSTHTSAPDTAPEIAPTRRRLETQGKLLDGALEVFSELGLQGASVEAICARAGFSRGAFYSNFSSKEQLFLALLAREFEHRATHLAARAEEIEPALRACGGQFSHEQAADFITHFFDSAAEDTTWFVLETEFLLLVIREPSLAPGYQQFLDSFHHGIAEGIEQILAAAGRRFVLPTERAIPVLADIYDRALRTAALAGADAGAQSGTQADAATPSGTHSAAAPAPAPVNFEQLGAHMAELLFAITEQIEA